MRYNDKVVKKSKPKAAAATTGLIIANILAGIYTPFIKYSLRFMPLYNFALIRHAGPAILIAPFMITRWKPIKRKDLLLSILCGLLLYCGANLFVYLGLQRTSSINTALILMLEPVLLFVFSVELMRERFKKKIFGGLLIAFFGSAVIILGPTLGKTSLTAGNLAGNLFIVAAVGCSVVSVWLMKYLTRRVPTLQVLFIGLVAATSVYFVLALPTIKDMSALNNSVVLFSALYGVVAVGLLSYWLLYWCLKTLGGQEYSLVMYVEPTVTALVAFLFFKESFTSITLIGVVIVFIGVWLAEIKIHHHSHVRSK
jgi:drug/metabolite transporter (DMT)-like permease